MAVLNMKFKLPLAITKKEKWYVAKCPILDIYSHGETYPKAKKNLIESISLFLETCFEQGTLDAVLKECGFKNVPKSEKSIHRAKEEDSITIPLYLLSDTTNSKPCHA